MEKGRILMIKKIWKAFKLRRLEVKTSNWKLSDELLKSLEIRENGER